MMPTTRLPLDQAACAGRRIGRECCGPWRLAGVLPTDAMRLRGSAPRRGSRWTARRAFIRVNGRQCERRATAPAGVAAT